jgi:hypothetical protein
MERIRQTTIVDIADRLLFLGRWNNLIEMMERGEVTTDELIGFLVAHTGGDGIDRFKSLISAFFGKDVSPKDQTQLYKDVASMAEDLRDFFERQSDNPPRMVVSPQFFNELLKPKG